MSLGIIGFNSSLMGSDVWFEELRRRWGDSDTNLFIAATKMPDLWLGSIDIEGASQAMMVVLMAAAELVVVGSCHFLVACCWFVACSRGSLHHNNTPRSKQWALQLGKRAKITGVYN